jgi:cytoskeletal protein CcmA (bactofilin family)
MAFFNDDISINSILGQGSVFKGNLKINGFTRIDGDLDGDLETTGKVIVGENARIKGNITAKSVTVDGGIVKGNIIAPEFVTIHSNSAIIGDIQTRRFNADDNIILNGHCIALSNENEYKEAQQRWQNETAIVSKSIFGNINHSKSGQNSSDQDDVNVDENQVKQPRGLFAKPGKKR